MFQDRILKRKLTEKLKQMNIRYRWELPEDFSFNYRDIRETIKTTGQMIKFMYDYSKDFEEE